MQSVAPPPFLGTRRFTIRRRVGQGAVGVVYEAWDEELQSRVALKALRALAPDTLLSLKKDFRAVQDIRHPNLVRTGELFEENGTWFFSMEFVDGVPLLRWLRPGMPSHAGSIPPLDAPVAPAPPRYDEGRLRAALPQLVNALDALHAAGKLHRDVKPPNVLVTPAGRVVLVDFGVAADLAREVDDDGDDDLVGTVAYMAPEQALAEAVGPATDFYALGVLLYEALTGRLPFYGVMHEVVAKKLAAPPPPPSSFVSGVPRDLDELCVDLLRPSPEQRPDAASMLRRLQVEAGAEASSGAMPAAVFVGRREELSALTRAYDDVREGATVTALVHGESGVGKSFLVRRFLEDLRAQHPNALVLAGRCFERESVPYKAVDGLVDHLRRYLGTLDEEERRALLPPDAALLPRAFPVLKGMIDERPSEHAEMANLQALRARMFAALRELLGRLAATRPLVLSIDDLQWADKDSLELLADVMRPPGAPRLLLLATMRMATDRAPLSGRGRLESLEMVGDVRNVHVRHLPDAEARSLVQTLLGGARADDAMVEEMVAESKGHPLFIDELVRQGGSASRGRVLRLDDALWARVTRLERPAQRLLELIAVAGLPIAQGVAAEAAGIELGELYELAGELRAGHLVKTSGARREDAIEAYHDRVRQSVLAHLDDVERKGWHGRLAAALERLQSDDAESLAVHWQGAGNPARSAEYAARAGDVAARTLAFEHAARLYRMALAAAPHAAPERRELERRLAEALTNGGYVADAAEVNLALARSETGERATDLERRAAEQLLTSGRFDQGLALLRSVLEAVGIYYPGNPFLVLLSLLVARVLLTARGLKLRPAPRAPDAAAVVRADAAWSAGAGFAMTDNVRGAYFQTRNLLYSLQLGDKARVAKALAMEVCFRSAGGRKAEAKTAAHLAQAWAIARDVGTPDAMAMASSATGYHHFMVGRWREARAAFLEGEAIFRDQCVGVTFSLNSVRTMLYRSLAQLGRLRELGERVPPVLREVEKHADQYGLANIKSGPTIILGLRDDEAVRAREELAEASERLPRGTFLIQHYYTLVGECMLDLYAGDGTAALGRIQAAWPVLRRSLLLRVQTVRVQVVEARARAALSAATSRTSAQGEVLKVAEVATAQLAREGLPWSDALTGMLRGGIANARGDKAAAADHLRSAALRFDALEMRLYAAACRRRRGEIVGGAEGAELVSAADARFTEEGVKRPERMARIFLPAVR